MDAAQAVKLDGEAFPHVVDDVAGGAPQLLAGQRLLGYSTANTAQLELPEHKYAVLESLSPIAIETSSTPLPIDLSLSEAAGGQFQTVRGLVGVRIPKRLADGISLSAQGVSLTPVDGQGQSLSGSEGSLAGAGVLYANTQVDTDTLVKPTTDGFDVDGLLRSVQSPEQLYFRVGMPAGAQLASDSQGGAVVTLEGQTIASVLPSAAQDEAGSVVPASMSVSGDVLVVRIDHGAGSYQYPIDVDPSIIDSQLQKEGTKRSNWEFATEPTKGAKLTDENSTCKGPGAQYLETCNVGEYKTPEFAAWVYQTRGNSKIFEFKGETEGENTNAKIESRIELQDGGTTEEVQLLSTELKEPKYAKKPLVEPLCPKGKSTCTSSYGGEKNAVHFQQSTTGSGSKFFDYMYNGEVSVTEPEEHATTKYNTTSPELEGEVINTKSEKEKIKRKNVLDGGGWLSEHDGAIEFISEDKGIGVSATQLEYENAPGKWEQIVKHNYLTEEDLCKGYQCEPKDEEFWVLNPKLPNGEDKIRYRAEDGMGSATKSTESEGVATIKVDTAKPRKLQIGGLPYGNELSEKPYPLTVQATDGEGTTVVSSGIVSIALYIDGGLIGTNGGTGGKEGPEGKCPEGKGECTASAKWTINGAELGAGKHQIEVIAYDRAGNEERFYDPISIRHSTPVAFGPGSVDLESGDYALSATDVSMGSGLTVSRAYSSRALREGEEGALSPQWSLTVGGSAESLVELVDHGMLMTDNNGRQTIFAEIAPKEPKTETPTYESPTGDSNLKLTLEENKTSHVKEAFYLEDAADHTKVKFALPSGGTKVWVPTRQEGAAATDTVTYSYQTAEQSNEYPAAAGSEPGAITEGPDGNVWFTESGAAKIGKINPGGVVTEYSIPSGHASGITSGPDKNLWFTNTSTSQIGKMTTSGAVTMYSLPTGSNPTNIVAIPGGNLWFLEEGTNKIGEITTAGTITEYMVSKENVKLDGLTVGPEGSLWFTVFSYSEIGKMTTSGVITWYSIAYEAAANSITTGLEGDLWFTEAYGPESGAPNVGKITPSGMVTEYPLPEGSSVSGIVAGLEGNLWFVDGSSKIGKVTTAGHVTEYSQPSGSRPDSITTGPGGNFWFSDWGTSKIGTISPAATVTEPTEALAPVPAKVECPKEKLKAGCRALKFVYATATTAKGENQSEWGEFRGRLTKVLFEGYNPVSKKVEEPGIAVAEYSYDNLGRLRAEWDPRIEKSTACGGNCPTLKTTYGYDAEGHITAMTAPGQESWAFTYGSIVGDAGTGRLIKATQAPASASLWTGALPAYTEAPKITGTPVVGARLATTNGVWSGNPVSYAYQWEDCNRLGEACQPIAGATNPNYTVAENDVEDTIRVQVSAINGGGSSVAIAAPTEFAKWTMTPTYEGSLSEKYRGEGEEGGMALDTKGDVWVSLDGSSTSALEEINGEKLTIGSQGSGNGQLAWPGQVVIDSKDHFWVADTNNDRIEQFGAKGEYVSQFGKVGAGNGEFKVPRGVAVDSKGDIWVADTGNNRIQEFNSEGKWMRTIGEKGKGNLQFEEPWQLAVDTKGNVWVADFGNLRVQELNENGEYLRQFKVEGEEHTGEGGLEYPGKGPRSITVGPHNDIWVSGWEGGPIQEFNELGESITKFGTYGEYEYTGTNKIYRPYGLAANSSTIFVAEEEHRVATWTTTGTPTQGELHTPQPGLTIDYNVPLEGSGAPAQMGLNSTTHKPEPESWGQTDLPVEATSIFPADSPQGWPASSTTRASTYYLDEEGRVVNVASPSNGKFGAISTTEYNEENDATRTLTPDNRATALEAGEKAAEVATLLSSYNTFENKCGKESEFNEERESSEFGTRLCETEGPMHTVKYTEGKEQKEGLARAHTIYFYDQKVPAEGPNKESFSKEVFNLVTETKTFTKIVNSKGIKEKEIEPRTTITSYSGQSNLGWKLRAPTSVTTDAQLEGQKLTHTTLYNEQGQVEETRGPTTKDQSGESPADSKIVYYTPENEAVVENCRKHPEWTGLICQTLPAKQPETSGVPNLPVTETTYNLWDEPEKAVEAFKFSPHPTSIRTRKDEYDTAGRLTSSQTTVEGNEDKTLPKVTYEYEAKQGTQNIESAPIGGKTKTITSKFNTLGQLTEYSDASEGNIAKYTYNGPEKDFQIQEVSDSSNGAKSNQKYAYNKNTMQLETLSDSAAETFTASYDTEGKLTSEIYPNGMCANYTYNSVGEATHLEYIKTTNCAEGSKAPVWYSETIGSTVRGETLNRTSTLATENYTYDTLGRLTEAQETPAGGECSVRLYEYEKESNRTKLTSRKPGSKGECATTGGTEEKHTYDEANRMTDTGIEYEGLGNITKLPAADAEGHELKSTFYVDGAVATQTQNSVTNEYGLDPAGRVLTTATGGKTTINHYDGSGEAVAWACEAAIGTETCETGKWTRNIPGIDGTLAAVQTNGGTPVLQLHDLKGDVIATAELSPSATKLESTYNSTEFGVPNKEKTPPPFAWLGAADISTSLSSGVITYGATSYVPQTGRTLQSLPVQSPGYPTPIGGGTYATFTAEPWNMQGAARVEAEAPGIAAAEQREAWEVALKNAIAEEQDPVFHYRAWEAKLKAQEVNHDLAIGNALEAVGVFLGSLDEAAERSIKSLWSDSVVGRWAGEAEEYLGFCVNTLHSDQDSHGGCRMLFYDMFWEGSEVPNFFEKPVISYCLKMSSNTVEIGECTLEKFEDEVHGVEASQ